MIFKSIDMKKDKKSNAIKNLGIVILVLILLVSSVAAVSASANFKANTTKGSAPLTVQFTDKSTGNPAYWTWVFGDGTSLSGSDAIIDQNPIHVYQYPGSYTVSLTVRESGSTVNSTKYVKNYITIT